MRRNAMLEHSALLKTNEFYRTKFKPYADSKKLFTHPQLWEQWTPANYSAWISQFKDPAGYPHNCFGKYYNEVLVPSWKERGMNSSSPLPKPPAE